MYDEFRLTVYSVMFFIVYFSYLYHEEPDDTSFNQIRSSRDFIYDFFYEYDLTNDGFLDKTELLRYCVINSEKQWLVLMKNILIELDILKRILDWNNEKKINHLKDVINHNIRQMTTNKQNNYVEMNQSRVEYNIIQYKPILEELINNNPFTAQADRVKFQEIFNRIILIDNNIVQVCFDITTDCQLVWFYDRAENLLNKIEEFVKEVDDDEDMVLTISEVLSHIEDIKDFTQLHNYIQPQSEV